MAGYGKLLLALAILATPVTAAAGTLDQLVSDLETKVSHALKKAGPAASNDLAIVVRSGPHVASNMTAVIARLLTAKLSFKGFRSIARWPAGQSTASSVERARVEGIELLLDLTATIASGQLHLRGELMATDTVIWRDVSLPAQRSLSHFHAKVRVDAEVRSFSGQLRPSRITLSEHRVGLGKRLALALAFADFDNDGRGELAVLTARSVEIYQRVSSGLLKRVARSTLGAPLEAVVSRRDLGVLHAVDLTADGRRELIARSSRFSMASIMSFDGRQLSVQRTVNGFPLVVRRNRGAARPWWLTADLTSGLDTFDAGTLQATATVGPFNNVPRRFYSLRGGTIATAGKSRQSFVATVGTSGRLQLYDETMSKVITTREGVGVAVDLLDLDDDGTLELITSGAGERDEADSVAIFRLENDQLRLKWQSGTLGGRVMAITHGDLDGDGRREVLCAVTTKTTDSLEPEKTNLVIFK